MHASHKWIRRALLGGVALGVMTTGSQAADDLSALQAQLEALQARVNQIEAQPAATRSAALPEGASFVSIRRGSNMPGFNDVDIAEASQQIPTDRGYTIAVMPTADMPAPIMEVTVSGYVKADFLYDFHNDMGDFASGGNVVLTNDDVPHFRAHARESRFRIKSRSDTAVGQIRTLIELDFYAGNEGKLNTPNGANGNQLISNSSGPRLRHAWGEWDISPNTTLGFGQFWSTWFPIGLSVPKLDFTSAAGSHFMRQPQFRVTHRSGPWTLVGSLDNPETDLHFANGVRTAESVAGGAPFVGGAADKAPDATATITYKSGGHIFKLSGVARYLSIDPDAGAAVTSHDSAFGWGVQGDIKLALTNAFAIFLHGMYGDGAGRYLLDNTFNAGTINAAGNKISTNTAWGFNGGISAKMTPTTTLNAVYGYFHQDSSSALVAVDEERQSVHVNIMWQPVSKFRLGLEGNYRYRETRLGADNDNFRIHAAAFFFF